jgi:hypothetical protein
MGSTNVARVSLLAALAALALANACSHGGGGGGGGAGGIGGIALSPVQGTSGNVTVPYLLSGTSPQDVTFQFSMDGGTTFRSASPAPGCPPTKALASGSYDFIWDTVADAASSMVIVRASAGTSSATAHATLTNSVPSFQDESAVVDASLPVTPSAQVHRGHYDLSPTVLGYTNDATFAPLCKKIPVKVWRTSVGRWEVGPTNVLAPEPACYSLDPNQLRTCSREFYRGASTIAAAQDPNNYVFGYLDGLVAAITACGAQPYLDFDATPFTLASNQDPNTANNLYLANNMLSFSNGIRTSPPLDPVVYAEVVKHVLLHVTGTFANGLGTPVAGVEIGNEPDAFTSPGVPANYFWTGTASDLAAVYTACVTTLDAQFKNTFPIGGCGFAWIPGEPTPTFAERFLQAIGGARLDFLSFHGYADTPETYFVERLSAIKALRDRYAPNAALHCSEWGMNLGTVDSRWNDMTMAVHHAKALEYFLLFGVSLSHRAVLRDVTGSPGANLGILTAPPAMRKPASFVFTAFDQALALPNLLATSSASPPGKPFGFGTGSSTAVSFVFFDDAPPPGEVGRFSLEIKNLPFASWSVTRQVLTDATVGTGDGLLVDENATGSGTFAETICFTQKTLVVWTLAAR